MIKFICQYGAKRLIIKSKGIEYGKEYEIFIVFSFVVFPYGNDGTTENDMGGSIPTGG